MTGLLVGVYAELVLLATRVLPLRGPVAVAGSRLAAATMFSPLRHWVQRAVDRRFNRTWYDAELMITAFAVRLQDATDLDAVRADPTSTVQRGWSPRTYRCGPASCSDDRPLGWDSALIRAAMAGQRRILSRQRLRFGPMLPTGMPSRALISA